MGNPLKKLLSLFFKTEQEEIANSVPKELNSEEILVVNKDTDLYHMVQRKLTKAADEVNTTKKIQDLEYNYVYQLDSSLVNLKLENSDEFQQKNALLITIDINTDQHNKKSIRNYHCYF